MHVRFYFLNRVSFVPKYREIHVFSQDSYTPSFLPEYSHQVFLTPSYLTQTPCLTSIIINFNVSFPLSCSFFTSVTRYPHILVPSKDDVKPIKQTSQIPMFNIFERFQRVPQQSERPYLRKRSLNVIRKPVPWNGIRLLLFDKCQFTRPLNWKKCWTCRTTHWPHIYQIWNQNLVLAISP